MKREIEEDDVIIMNFSGIYSLEKFSKDRRFKVMDFTDLQGTDGYCDPDTERTIKNLLAPIPYTGIHFLDTGDFHYLSKLWTDKIDQPFNLLVFDHHTDLQEPAFGDILSCGGWIKNVLRKNKNLNKVILVGPPASAEETLPEEYRDRIEFHPDTELMHGEQWRHYIGQNDSLPLYISIDKDVLTKRDCPTNWDQGKLSMPLLEEMLTMVIGTSHVLGIDICGECSPSLDFLEKTKEAGENNTVNIELLQTILQVA